MNCFICEKEVEWRDADTKTKALLDHLDDEHDYFSDT